MGQELHVTPRLRIPLDEIEWRFSTPGGPGGQHANRAATRAEARFDVAASPSLTDDQRARLLRALGPEVRAAADDERSQTRNREVALDRLRARLAGALRERRRRVPTRPSKASRERRLREKRARSEKKRLRRPPPS